jgi:hypothetical protein
MNTMLESAKSQLEVLDARELTSDAALAIGELIARVWPKPEKPAVYRQNQILDTAQAYSGPEERAPRAIQVWEAGRVIAHASLVPRTIRTELGEIVVAGLSRVCSDPDKRGCGLGELVVRQVFGFVDRGIFPFSLFQTTPTVQPFYKKLGCCLVTNRFVNSLGGDPTANPFWDPVIMRYPLSGTWPEGEIDLRGPAY